MKNCIDATSQTAFAANFLYIESIFFWQTVGLRDLPMDAMFFPSIDLMDGVDHLSMNPPDELHQDRKS